VKAKLSLKDAERHLFEKSAQWRLSPVVTMHGFALNVNTVMMNFGGERKSRITGETKFEDKSKVPNF
jgi:hypothetical protein